MRKREVKALEKKLLLLKQEYIDNINQSDDNIATLNDIKSSEEVDIGNISSIANISENILARYNSGLKDINNALNKIKSNKYGKCEMCGEQIDIRRLRAKPQAKYCITCREIYESKNKIRSF